MSLQTAGLQIVNVRLASLEWILCNDRTFDLRPGRIETHFATSQDGSVQPPHEVCTFFEQAGLALCCEPRKVVRDVPVGLPSG